MSEPDSSVTAEISAIESEFDGWAVWLSDTGRWWATRRRPLSTDERNAGCVQFVQAETSHGLRERITDEDNMCKPLSKLGGDADA